MKLLTIIFILVQCYAFSQHNPTPYFINMGTEQGLPSPEVYCVFEDSKGYMWFGTDNGVSRFDGYDFRNYGTKDGLDGNVIFSVFEDKHERIWFGSMTKNVFLLEKDTIIPYKYNHLIKQYQSKFSGIGMVYYKEESTVYFELRGLGVLSIDSLGKDSLYTSKSSISTLALDFEHLPKLVQTQIGNISHPNYKADQKKLKGGRLFNINILTENQRINLSIPFLGTQNKNYFYKKNKGGGYLFFRPNHLWEINGDSISQSMPFPYPGYIIEDNQNKLWIGLLNGKGLRRYDSIESISQSKFESYLDGMSISNILIDRRGSLWITTLEKGVYYSANPEMLSYTTQFGLSSNLVHSISVKNENEVFIGCSNIDIIHLDVSNHKILDKIISSDIDNNKGVFFDKKTNKLWIGPYSYQNKILSQPKYVNGNFTNPILVKKAYHDSENDKLLVLTYSSWYEIDLKNNLFYRPDFSEDNCNDTYDQKDLYEWKSDSKRVYAILKDKENRFWIGSDNGIFQYEDSCYIVPNIEHPAFKTRVENIDQLSDSTIVFGTKGWGVIFWKNNSIVVITEENGLTANMIEDLHIDDSDNIWVATLNGLNKISSIDDSMKVRSFTISNGLPSNEIYKITSHKNQVWLGTGGGLVKFVERAKNLESPSPFIQEIKVNGNKVSEFENTDFSYVDNNWSFHFTTINFRQQDQTLYRYRISSNDAWELTNSRDVNYSKLLPGNYAFEVQSQNEDGYWSESTKFKFLVLTPWWKTWWARSLFLIFGIAGINLIIKYQKEKYRKETDIKKQMSSLKRSALHAQMNPHFIFNCLNSIQNLILKNDTHNAIQYLSKFADLVRQILNISIADKVSLSDNIKMIKNYLELEKLRFKDKLKYDFFIDERLEQNKIKIPPLLIQPYIENAIKHGRLNEDSQGEISIKYVKEQDYLVVSIKDNGVWVKDKKKSNSIQNYKSVGMSITKKRLELWDDSTNKDLVQIFPSDGEEIGTEVIVKLKLI